MTVIGWVDCWTSPYKQTTFTEEHRKALVERIRKRRYNFNYADHQTLPYSAPLFEDRMMCVLTKPQWDSVMDEVYADIPRGARLLPMDVIEDRPVNSILYEKKKFMEEYSDGKN